MTLKFNRVRAVVKIHAQAKFYQAKCSGSSVIVLTEKKKLRRKNTDGGNNSNDFPQNRLTKFRAVYIVKVNRTYC